jgi:hypothetical protein
MRRFAPTSKRSKSPVGVISRSAKAEQQRDQGSLTRAAIEKQAFVMATLANAIKCGGEK